MPKGLLKDSGWIAPQLPTLVADIPTGDGWIHEIKHDGWRVQIAIRRGGVRVFTRNGHDWTSRFCCIAQDALLLPCLTAVIDAEVIVQDEQGRSDFFALRRALDDEPHRVVAFAFDLLELNGDDLRDRPLVERRAMLRVLLGDNAAGHAIHFSDDLADGAALFAPADQFGLEGIVSKKANSRYRSGYAKTWLNRKCMAEGRYLVVGVDRGAEGPPHALLAREVNGRLHYAGSAFVTLRDEQRERFWRSVDRLRIDDAPVAIDKTYKAAWCRPELTVTARYLKGSDKLRHATLIELVN